MLKSLYTRQNGVLLEFLREARAACGVTQVDLAGRLGFLQADISKVERGVRRLDIIELRAWVAALGLAFRDFAFELDERLAATELMHRQAIDRRRRTRSAKEK